VWSREIKISYLAAIGIIVAILVALVSIIVIYAARAGWTAVEILVSILSIIGILLAPLFQEINAYLSHRGGG